MVTIGMNYEVLEGKESVLENAFTKVVHAMRQLEGARSGNCTKRLRRKGGAERLRGGASVR